MIRWKLNVVMAEKRMTVTKLVELTGISRQVISRMKNSDELNHLPMPVLDKLLTALGCTPNDLIEHIPGDPNSSPPPTPSSRSGESRTPRSRTRKSKKPKEPTPDNVIRIYFPRYSRKRSQGI